MNRLALRFVLASIAVNAVIGIIAIIGGDFSDLDVKVLLTSLSVTGASVLALASLTARGRGFLPVAPELGAVSSVVGFGLLVTQIWAEISGDTMWKAAGTGILISAAAAHASLLSLSRLAPRYRIALQAAWGLAALLVVLVLIVIWFEDVADTAAFAQVIGVTGVLLAAATLAVPVLHRASKGEAGVPMRNRDAGQAGEAPAHGRKVLHCPNCGSTDLRGSGGTGGLCGNCGAAFSVSFSG
jgi:hypothetical protein